MPPGTTVLPSSEYSVQIRFRASANVEDYAAPRTRSSILAVLLASNAPAHTMRS